MPLFSDAQTGQWHFLLGGLDLEMATIRELLQSESVPFTDKKLRWGASATQYRDVIAANSGGANPGTRLVLVELENDLEDDRLNDQLIWIDHHNDRAGPSAPTSLEQVFQLLVLPEDRWTRHFELVAANDRGHIDAMVEVGASRDEISEIRRQDRMLSGEEPDDEATSRKAIERRREFASGQLTIVELPHSRCGAVTDLLHPALGGPGYENLLVLSPDEVNFYGDGEVIKWLERQFPGGWSGGELPVRGFWGKSLESAEQALLIGRQLTGLCGAGARET